MTDVKARPTVNVYDITGQKAGNTALPDVFLTPIRPDIIKKIHALSMHNTRQPQGRKLRAGMGYAAESWGTGRAVSRIPRIPGGGTHKAGSGAFGNMCVGGRVFSPLRTWRRWHHKIPDCERRYAITSAIAASGNVALVMAHGHKISQVEEIPLVVSDKLQEIKKTRDAVSAFKALGLSDEMDSVKASKKLRSTSGKKRGGRRHLHKRGALIVYKDDHGIKNAVKNIMGFHSVEVDKLNILGLAPGGKAGRLVIWTESAFKYLNTFFGTYGNKPDALIRQSSKIPYRLPRPIMINTDVQGIIKSDTIQNVIADPDYESQKKVPRRKNFLTNYKNKVAINPFAATLIRRQYKENLRKKQLVSGVEKPNKTDNARKELLKKVKEGMKQNYWPKVLGPELVAIENKEEEEQN